MTSTQNTTATIETLARECAAQAIDQGATGPWTGDLQQPDLDYVASELGRPMTRDEVRVFDQAFRAAF
jgi:hypothetical protein